MEQSFLPKELKGAEKVLVNARSFCGEMGEMVLRVCKGVQKECGRNVNECSGLWPQRL